MSPGATSPKAQFSLENLQKAARAKVTGVREDLLAGLAGDALAPRRPAPSQRSRSALRALPRLPGPSSLRRPRRLLLRARSRGPGPPRTVSRESGVARRSRHCSGLPGGARGACAAAYGSPEGGGEVRLRFLRAAAAAAASATGTRLALAP